MGFFGGAQKRVRDGWKRTERARAGLQVPLALATQQPGLPQQTHLAPPPTPTEYRQELTQEEQKQYGHVQLERAKEDAGRVVPADARQARPQPGRETPQRNQAEAARQANLGRAQQRESGKDQQNKKRDRSR